MLNDKPLHSRLFILIALLLSVSCATRRAPGGGPVDRIPPTVLHTNPAKDSLHIPLETSEIEILFSERMEQSSLKSSLYISPPLEYEIDWKNWEKVLLHLKENLLPDQTYVISIAPGVQDLHKNSMAQSYQFAFSTGNKLDQNSISGKMFGLKKDQAVNLFAYILSDTSAFRPSQKKPLYVSKSGTDGSYQLSYLKNGQYRILAVEDMNHNLLADADFELVGIPFRDVRLDSLHTQSGGVDFFRLTRSDTTAPTVLGVRPLFDKTLQLRLSEPVLIDTLFSLSVTDSVSGDTLSVLDMRLDDEFNNILTLFTGQSDSAAVYKMSLPFLQDSSLNRNDSIPDLYFHSSLKQDTVQFRLVDFIPKDSTKNVPLQTKIQLQFSQAADRQALSSAFHLYTEGGRRVAGSWELPTVKTAVFTPWEHLQPDSAYRAEIDLNRLSNVWGKMLADSVISHYFTIVPFRELGEVSGRVQFQRDSEKPVRLELRSLKKGQTPFRTTAKSSGGFRIENIPEGKYILNGYLDENENGRYSPGKLFPFHLSEPFSVSSDTIKVRKRWETENVEFFLPVPERNHGAVDSVYQD